MKRTREGYPYRQVKYQGYFGYLDTILEFHYYFKHRIIQKEWLIDECGENTRCIINIKKNVDSDEFHYRVQFEDLDEGCELIGITTGCGSFERIQELIEMAIINGVEKETFDGDYDPYWYENVLKEFVYLW